MYWNYVYSPFFCDNCMININMRCIEIVIMDGLLDRDVWLTLTWDVLKWGRSGRITCRKHGLTLTWDVLKLVFDRWKINAFQRLTLTWDVLKSVWAIMKLWRFVININVRCIEICIFDKHLHILLGLTLTWDVLKFISIMKNSVICSD